MLGNEYVVCWSQQRRAAAADSTSVSVRDLPAGLNLLRAFTNGHRNLCARSRYTRAEIRWRD